MVFFAPRVATVDGSLFSGEEPRTPETQMPSGLPWGKKESASFFGWLSFGGTLPKKKLKKEATNWATGEILATEVECGCLQYLRRPHGS